MTQNTFKDLFSLQALDYSKFRPHYPRELFDYLKSQCKHHECAWDVGTGNGQAATELAKDFKKVIATDPSEKQLQAAIPHPKVNYIQLGAEDASQIPDNGIDLISVAQAFHWFNHKLFFEECKRVAKPGAVLAVWSYELAHITPEVDEIVNYYYREIIGEFWEPERKLVETGYKTIQVPFEEISTPTFFIEADWSLEQLMGYLNTWSATQTALKKMKAHPLETIRVSLSHAWGKSSKHLVRWPLALRVFRL